MIIIKIFRKKFNYHEVKNGISKKHSPFFRKLRGEYFAYPNRVILRLILIFFSTLKSQK